MRAKNLVVGKHYNYTRASSGQTFRVVYLGRCGEDTLFEGDHDFGPVDKGSYAGSIHDDDGLYKISEIEEGEELS